MNHEEIKGRLFVCKFGCVNSIIILRSMTKKVRSAG